MTAPHSEHHASLPMTPAGVAIRLVIAWTIVGLPLAWGIYRTYITAEPLFVSAPVAPANK